MIRAVFFVVLLNLLQYYGVHTAEVNSTVFTINIHGAGADTIAVEVALVPGASVFNVTKEFCNQVNEDLCVDTMDAISNKYYGNSYTPSRITSDVVDFTSSRSALVLYLHERYNLKRYLEIGCWMDLNFNVVRDAFDVAIGVDPDMGGTHRMTSTDFFLNNTQMFDLIFIDGLHEAHQVWEDIHFALRFLSPNGFILLHDLNPRTHDRQVYPMLPHMSSIWNGDCWKAGVAMRLMDHVELVIADFDHGVGIARRMPNEHRLPMEWERKLFSNPIDTLKYADLEANRDLFLRLMSMSEMYAWLNDGDAASAVAGR